MDWWPCKGLHVLCRRRCCSISFRAGFALAADLIPPCRLAWAACGFLETPVFPWMVDISRGFVERGFATGPVSSFLRVTWSRGFRTGVPFAPGFTPRPGDPLAGVRAGCCLRGTGNDVPASRTQLCRRRDGTIWLPWLPFKLSCRAADTRAARSMLRCGLRLSARPFAGYCVVCGCPAPAGTLLAGFRVGWVPLGYGLGVVTVLLARSCGAVGAIRQCQGGGRGSTASSPR